MAYRSRAVCRPMVCQPGRSVPHMDRAAGEEAVLFQQMLHGAVVGVGIRSDIPGNGLAVVRSTAEETVCPAVPGQTVDGPHDDGAILPWFSRLSVPFGRTFRPFGREASFRIDFLVGIYYSTIIKIKQVLNG